MRYADANRESLPESIQKAIEKSIAEKKGLFFIGDTGTGKTYALHALAQNRGKVENFVELLIEFRDYMQKGYYFDRIKNLTSQDYLFIDDIGSEKVSDFVIEFLYMVINKRYENMKKTVLSTNLNLEEFKSRYGDRILSRICEMCEIVFIKGNDKRLS